MLLIAAAIAACLSESIASGSVQDVDRSAVCGADGPMRFPCGKSHLFGVEFANRRSTPWEAGSSIWALINVNAPHVSQVSPRGDRKTMIKCRFRSSFGRRLSLHVPRLNLHKLTRQVEKVNILLFPAPPSRVELIVLSHVSKRSS